MGVNYSGTGRRVPRIVVGDPNANCPPDFQKKILLGIFQNTPFQEKKLNFGGRGMARLLPQWTHPSLRTTEPNALTRIPSTNIVFALDGITFLYQLKLMIATF